MLVFTISPSSGSCSEVPNNVLAVIGHRKGMITDRSSHDAFRKRAAVSNALTEAMLCQGAALSADLTAFADRLRSGVAADFGLPAAGATPSPAAGAVQAPAVQEFTGPASAPTIAPVEGLDQLITPAIQAFFGPNIAPGLAPGGPLGQAMAPAIEAFFGPAVVTEMSPAPPK